MERLKDKVVIITGGTKGIGLETSKLLADEGARVIACARNPKVFDDPNIEFMKLDVNDVENCKTVFESVIQKYGRIDGLVCDAGITSDALTFKMTDEQFDRVVGTNLKGTFNMVKFIGPFMERQGFGSIVNISSVVGIYGNIGQVNYAASKAGIIGMSLSWAKEFARKGANVRVNVLAPGYIQTEMLSSVPQELLDKFSSQTMLKRLGKPEEIAKCVLFLISDDSSYVTGTVLSADGGMRF